MKTKRTTILWWVIALLVILNITTITTVFYHARRENKFPDKMAVEKAKRRMSGKHFCKTMDLDNEQMAFFRENNKQFRQKTGRIIISIDTRKKLMYDMLCSSQPDTAMLYSLCSEIGMLHEDLKEETVNFYFLLSNECKTPEQKEHLNKMFMPFFCNEGPPVRGKGNMRRRMEKPE